MFLYLWMMIQVIAESLPISSSGHVALMHEIVDRFHTQCCAFEDAWAFDYFLQGVSALIFLIYFFSLWWKLIVDKPIQFSALLSTDVWKKFITQVCLFGIAADGMTFLFWYYKVTELIDLPLVVGFIITACSLWSIQFAVVKKDIDIWSVKNGLIAGLVQGCSLLPGISRFGTTFAALRWLGYKNRDAFSISFLIQWPLIVAGSYVGLKALIELGQIHEVINPLFIMITLIAAVCAYGLLYVVQKIIDKNQFWKFFYYMIIPIIIALFI